MLSYLRLNDGKNVSKYKKDMAKYCNNCKVVRDSWSDKGYSGSNDDIRCYVCDKYTLSSGAVYKPSESDANKLIKVAGNALSSYSGAAEAEYKSESGIRHETNAVVEYSSQSIIIRKSK